MIISSVCVRVGVGVGVGVCGCFRVDLNDDRMKINRSYICVSIVWLTHSLVMMRGYLARVLELYHLSQE